MASRPGLNLRTYLERIIMKAGHTLWPRLLQNLRASCATDWVKKYPSHEVLAAPMWATRWPRRS